MSLFRFFNIINSNYSSLSRDSLLLTGSQGARSLLGIIQAAVIVQFYGLNGYGIVTLALSIYMLFRIPVEIKLDQLAHSFEWKIKNLQTSLNRMELLSFVKIIDIIISVICCIALLTLSSSISILYDSNSLYQPLIIASTLYIAEAGRRSNQAFLSLKGDFHSIAIGNFIEAGVTCLIICTACIIEVRVPFLLLGYVAGALAHTLFLNMRYNFWTNHNLSFLSSLWLLRDGLKKLKPLLTFTSHSAQDSLLSYFIRSIDPLILGIFYTPNQVGLFKICVDITSGIIQLPVASLTQVITREYSNAKTTTDTRKATKSGMIIICMWLLPTATALYFLKDFLLYWVYGVQSDPTTSLAINILCISYTVLGIFFWIKPLLVARGHFAFAVKLLFFLAIFRVLSSGALIYIFGLLGAIYSFSIAYAFGIPWALNYIHRNQLHDKE